MTYDEAISWLYSTQLFGIKLGLDGMRALLDALGRPDDGLRIVHVAGTNGKGSTCAFMDAMLRTAGKKTGLFTSPHLVCFRERIRIDGRLIPEAEVAARLTTLRDLVVDWERHPTFFELATVLALWWFRDAGVDAVILETGMGGRLDATNAIERPRACVITPIALDHMQWLGDTLAAIASEKAGIVKAGVPVVSARQAPEAAAVIANVAAEKGAPLTELTDPWPADAPLGLIGPHQRWNAAVAVAALKAAGFDLSPDAIPAGLAAARWPGRFQELPWNGRTVIIDGAHNPHGAAALVAAWQQRFPGVKADVIFGAVALKNHAEIIALLRPVAERWIFTTVRSSRAVPAAELATGVAEATVTGTLVDALAAAADAPRNRPLLIAGSLYLAGEALSLLAPESGAFEESSQ